MTSMKCQFLLLVVSYLSLPWSVSSQNTYNSTLACTRGSQQTNLVIDCRTNYQDGGTRSLSILRVFSGTTPTSSGCNITAPYASCCVRDPNKPDCVFQDDSQLQAIINYCSGGSYCNFAAKRNYSALGNCDPNIYPSLTSFSFVEYKCLTRQETESVCHNVTNQQTGLIFLESNTVTVGGTITNSRCQCFITTDCDSTLTFFAITIQLTQVNATVCAEEIFFTDAQYPQLTRNLTCRNDDNVVYNQTLFTTISNMATFSLVVTGQQKGKFFILVQSSVPTANVTLNCGTPAVLALNQSQQCPTRTTTTVSPTTTIVPQKPVIEKFNSSLACTRGESQTYHILNCGEHYQDGGTRVLHITRVFYGATPISRGCNSTASYLSCCVRDPKQPDCVFEDNDQLQDIVTHCSDSSYCSIEGKSISSSLGNCDQNIYLSLTSFSFVEYECLQRQVTGPVCLDSTNHQTGQISIVSNAIVYGESDTTSRCQCHVSTDCGSTLTFFATNIYLTQINATVCAEEIFFTDAQYPQLTRNVTCRNYDNVGYNQPLFTTLSTLAIFSFVVTGPHYAVVDIRVQASTSTAIVSLNCGTPAVLALNQSQQCPTLTTTTVSPTTTIVTQKPVIEKFNSSLACTRGESQTYHILNCGEHYQDGGTRVLHITRVFYGATPISSGCNNTAPYMSCCVRDPGKPDCVFEDDDQLQYIDTHCSGSSYCSFEGKSVLSSLGNCNPGIYPSMTSFSFVEYTCLTSQKTDPVCHDVTDHQTGQIYLESNTVVVEDNVTNSRCQCLITTDCDSTLTFFAVIVKLTQVNTTVCAEEIFFTDAQYPQLTRNVTCRNNDNVVYNQTLFTTISNKATFLVTGQQQGNIYIRVQSSVPTANVTLTCGTPGVMALSQSQQCPSTTVSTTTTSVTRKPVGATFNSSLACTRGSTQTNHIIDCRDHYSDGGTRVLNIIQVFYGATPLSSNCTTTAPYTSCCVRDPNKPDCVFANNIQLQDIVTHCSGSSYCSLSGIRLSSSLGNCDSDIYPPVTSFSFVEYECLPKPVSVCRDGTNSQTGQIYLESNTVVVGNTVTNSRCQCLITTNCDSTLTFFAVIVKLTQVNTTVCAEEIFFTDAQYPQLTRNVTCRNNDNVVYNQTLFTTISNMATFSLVVTGQQQGMVDIRVQSSVPTANVTLTCGTYALIAPNPSQQCPTSSVSPTITPYSSSQPSTASTATTPKSSSQASIASTSSSNSPTSTGSTTSTASKPNSSSQTSTASTPNLSSQTSTVSTPNPSSQTSTASTPNPSSQTSTASTPNPSTQTSTSSTTSTASPPNSSSQTSTASTTSTASPPNSSSQTSTASTTSILNSSSQPSTASTPSSSYQTSTASTLNPSSQASTASSLNPSSQTSTASTTSTLNSSSQASTASTTSTASTPNSSSQASTASTPNSSSQASTVSTTSTLNSSSQASTASTTSTSSTPNSSSQASTASTPNSSSQASTASTPSSSNQTSKASTPNSSSQTSTTSTLNSSSQASTASTTSTASTPNSSSQASTASTLNSSQTSTASTPNLNSQTSTLNFNNQTSSVVSSITISELTPSSPTTGKNGVTGPLGQTGTHYLDTGAIIGIVFGILAGVLLASFFVFILIKYRNRCSRNAAGSDSDRDELS